MDAQQRCPSGSRPPNLPHGAAHGAPAAGPRFESQNKPFFLVHPQQPYVPVHGLQWPVPVPYNPYFGYPGLGYGMPVMSHYQTNPYLEPPGYVLPHTPYHLMDYRRLLNPHYYQTMAFHSRRFRYQHNSSSKETTTSEVQTEPLVASHRINSPAEPTDAASPSVFQPGSSEKPPGVSSGELVSQASTLQKVKRSSDLKEKTPSPNGSFMIQTEEVTIECCTSPVGLQLLQAHESAEVSHMVKCDSVIQTSVLKGGNPRLAVEPCPHVCPDILLVGRPGSDEKVPNLEESNEQTSGFDLHDEATEKGGENGLEFKVVHRPFEAEPSNNLMGTDSFLWSMEETVTPPDPSDLQASSESQDETLIAECTEILMLNEGDVATEEVPKVPVNGEKDPDLCAEAPGMVIVSRVEEYCLTDAVVTEVARPPLAEGINSPGSFSSERSLLRAGDGTQQRAETNTDDHQDTSFESLPAYLPSTNWLADFDKLPPHGMIPPAPKKLYRSPSKSVINLPSRRRKLDMESKDHAFLRKPKEKCNPKGKAESRSLSDHEYCLSRSLSENLFSPCVSRRDQLCSRCLEKCGPSGLSRLDFQNFKRKSALFHQWVDGVLPTCESCKSHTKGRPTRKCSKGDFQRRGVDTEGDSSENSCCRIGSKWKLMDTKRPLSSKQNLEKCPVVNSRLKEKNCLCNEPRLQPGTWEQPRLIAQRNAVRESDENCAAPVSLQAKWRNPTHAANRWQMERSWKSTLDADGCRASAGSPLSNKHKKSHTQSQECRRKDARC